MNTLILGDGLLGSELKKQTNWDVASRKLTNIDINKLKLLKNLLSKYDTVINCIANTNTYSEDKNDHFNVNYKFAINLNTS